MQTKQKVKLGLIFLAGLQPLVLTLLFAFYVYPLLDASLQKLIDDGFQGMLLAIFACTAILSGFSFSYGAVRSALLHR